MIILGIITGDSGSNSSKSYLNKNSSLLELLDILEKKFGLDASFDKNLTNNSDLQV